MTIRLRADEARRLTMAIALSVSLVLPSAWARMDARQHDGPSPTCGRKVAFQHGGWDCSAQSVSVDPVRGLLVGAKMDLATVTGNDLQIIPGIGPRLAARIIEDRERFGVVPALKGLERVRGVGPVLRRRLETYLRLSEE